MRGQNHAASSCKSLNWQLSKLNLLHLKNQAEFPSQSTQDWASSAERELRGKPLESISWKFESLSINPFRNSVGDADLFNIRKVGATNDWQIRQDFRSDRALELARNAVSGGAHVVGLPTDKLQKDLEETLSFLADHNAKLVLLDPADSSLMVSILEAEKRHGQQLLYEIEGVTEQMELSRIVGAERFLPTRVIDTYFGINDSGSETIFELALALAAGHHSLVQLMDEGFSIDQAAAMISFKIGVNGTYLIEVCKWRVFRKLWATIIEAYEPVNSCSVNTRITANLSTWNKTVIDVDGNLIRQAAESMAAAIGGADSILIPPFDHRESARSARLARNIHHLLKGESWMSHVKDPVAGSYFFEELSVQLADEVWQNFQKLDPEYEGVIRAGGIRDMLNEQRQKSLSKLNEKDEIRVGGNKYQLTGIQPVVDVMTSTSAWEKKGQ